MGNYEKFFSVILAKMTFFMIKNKRKIDSTQSRSMETYSLPGFKCVESIFHLFLTIKKSFSQRLLKNFLFFYTHTHLHIIYTCVLPISGALHQQQASFIFAIFYYLFVCFIQCLVTTNTYKTSNCAEQRIGAYYWQRYNFSFFTCRPTH